jgi:hypothetical protein
MSKPSSITRRSFLATSTKAASAIAAANILLRPSRVPGAPRRLSPNEKLNIAFIGVGGQGGADLDSITRAEDVNVVALCDVDENNLNRAATKFPTAKRYRDYRKLLETEKSLDAVTVGIPDHSHAPASMMAIKHGRHVYCEKPLTRTVKEARALTLAAREAKVATQMGTSGSTTAPSGRCARCMFGPTGQPIAASCRSGGRRVLSDRVTRHPCPPHWIGTCGWGRHRCARIIRHTCPSNGAVGGISVPAAWATWASTISRRCFQR